MLKNLQQLNKEEKIDLLKSVASGEVIKESIEGSIFVTDPKDAFLSLMVATSSCEQGKEATIIGLGEGKKALEKQAKAIELIISKRTEL